jgi:RNA polymerase sigma factor (sigma-70 family)
MTMTVGVFKNRYMKNRIAFRDLKREPFDALDTLDDIAVETDDILVQRDIRKKLTQCLLKLKPREERIIRERFFYGKSLEEVGQTLCITRERVRGIECHGLQKLKNQMIKDEDFLDLVA